MDAVTDQRFNYLETQLRILIQRSNQNPDPHVLQQTTERLQVAELQSSMQQVQIAALQTLVRTLLDELVLAGSLKDNIKEIIEITAKMAEQPTLVKELMPNMPFEVDKLLGRGVNLPYQYAAYTPYNQLQPFNTNPIPYQTPQYFNNAGKW